MLWLIINGYNYSKTCCLANASLRVDRDAEMKKSESTKETMQVSKKSIKCQVKKIGLPQ